MGRRRGRGRPRRGEVAPAADADVHAGGGRAAVPDGDVPVPAGRRRVHAVAPCRRAASVRGGAGARAPLRGRHAAGAAQPVGVALQPVPGQAEAAGLPRRRDDDDDDRGCRRPRRRRPGYRRRREGRRGGDLGRARRRRRPGRPAQVGRVPGQHRSS